MRSGELVVVKKGENSGSVLQKFGQVLGLITNGRLNIVDVVERLKKPLSYVFDVPGENPWCQLSELNSAMSHVMERDPDRCNEIAAVLQEIISLPAWVKLPKMFKQIADLGEIIVPADYVNETQLNAFRERCGGMFTEYNSDITDENFVQPPSHILRPGERYRALVFQADPSVVVTPDECLTFVDMQGGVRAGAQGLSLVFQQKHLNMPWGYDYVLLDKEFRFWKSVGIAMVPVIVENKEGKRCWHVVPFDAVASFRGSITFICLVEVKAD